jgi:hypothetical protein
MEMHERSYSGKLQRPTPVVHIEEDGSFGVIATPWGNRQGAEKIIELMKDYILSARHDMEATSPFQKLSCLSPLANTLRVGIMLANDSLYREDNKAEYMTGVETVVFSRSEQEFAYAQVGSPQMFLARQNFPWIPISVQIDLSTEWSQAPGFLPPLPQNLLGLNTTSNMNIGSFKVQPSDKMVFLSHSIVSHPVFNLSYESSDIHQVSSILSKQHPDLPFWLGVLHLS